MKKPSPKKPSPKKPAPTKAKSNQIDENQDMKPSESKLPPPPPMMSLDKVTGTIKNWNYITNKGDIIKDGDNKIILCELKHCSLNQPDQPPKVGSKIEFVMVKDENGTHAQHVTAIGGGPCLSGRTRGFVQTYDKVKGNGKITAIDGSEVFNFKCGNLWKIGRPLVPGDCVEFDPQKDTRYRGRKGGFLASFVTLSEKKPNETFMVLHSFK